MASAAIQKLLATRKKLTGHDYGEYQHAPGPTPYKISIKQHEDGQHGFKIEHKGMTLNEGMTKSVGAALQGAMSGLAGLSSDHPIHFESSLGIQKTDYAGMKAVVEKQLEKDAPLASKLMKQYGKAKTSIAKAPQLQKGDIIKHGGEFKEVASNTQVNEHTHHVVFTDGTGIEANPHHEFPMHRPGAKPTFAAKPGEFYKKMDDVETKVDAKHIAPVPERAPSKKPKAAPKPAPEKAPIPTGAHHVKVEPSSTGDQFKAVYTSPTGWKSNAIYAETESAAVSNALKMAAVRSHAQVNVHSEDGLKKGLIASDIHMLAQKEEAFLGKAKQVVNETKAPEPKVHNLAITHKANGGSTFAFKVAGGQMHSGEIGAGSLLGGAINKHIEGLYNPGDTIKVSIDGKNFEAKAGFIGQALSHNGVNTYSPSASQMAPPAPKPAPVQAALTKLGVKTKAAPGWLNNAIAAGDKKVHMTVDAKGKLNLIHTGTGEKLAESMNAAELHKHAQDSGYDIHVETGPKGGQYHINKSGKKIYLSK
jgi:hypothetical protein